MEVNRSISQSFFVNDALLIILLDDRHFNVMRDPENQWKLITLAMKIDHTKSKKKCPSLIIVSSII